MYKVDIQLKADRSMISAGFVLGLLWLHFFWCLVPSWRFGEYYEYGFLVPVLAFGFAWRRDGTQLALVRGETGSDVILISNLRN